MIDLGDWKEVLSPLFQDERYLKIREFLKSEYQTQIVYPDMYDIYRCFLLTPFEKVKVVLLGQDPYHEPNQAHGLCFSVQKGVEIPPSLQNIFKELKSDLGISPPHSGDLTKWAKEGVLLLNTTLTVRRHRANSHADCGWSWFTDSVISLLSEKKQNLVFLLWGSHARRKAELIDASRHLILECAHPSPLSAFQGFFGCRHFSKTNDYLISKGISPIDWTL